MGLTERATELDNLKAGDIVFSPSEDELRKILFVHAPGLYIMSEDGLYWKSSGSFTSQELMYEKFRLTTGKELSVLEETKKVEKD